MTGPDGNWNPSIVGRTARRAAVEEVERREALARSSALAAISVAPEHLTPPPRPLSGLARTLSPIPGLAGTMERLVAASRTGLLHKVKYLIQVGPKGATVIIGRKLFRLPGIGYVLRTLSLIVRLPIVLRRLADRQQEIHQAHEAAIQSLWQGIAQEQHNREAAFEELVRIMTRVEVRGQDADQVLRGGLLELWKMSDVTGRTLVDLRRLINELQRKQVTLVAAPAALPAALAEPATATPPLAPVDDGAMAAFYMAFEDKFRGSREQIKEWQAVYLGRVTEAVRATGGTILDVGCGRGEWLELLTEKGFAARGVDLNDVAARECRSMGLDVTTGDALAMMRAMPADSLAVVSAFHVIEHLPQPVFFAFLDEVLRALKPGGLVIMETPNPGNLQVGAHKFWLDLTHLRPLPAETVSFAVESRGFTNVEVLPMHPNDQAASRYPDPLIDQLNQLIYGPQDYAVIGRK